MHVSNGLKLGFIAAVGVILILAGVRGNLGSVLAAILVPQSMLDGQLPPPCSSTTPVVDTTAAAIAAATTLSNTYAQFNGGVKPTPVIPAGTVNQCPPSYTYNYQLGQCVFSGTTGRHV